MTLRTFREMGEQLALHGWGQDDRGDLDTKIKMMPSDQRTYCVLAAVVGQLRDVILEIKTLRYDIDILTELTLEPSNAVADGMLEWMSVSMGDRLLSDMDVSKLSVRARMALRRAKVSMLSQITAERLEGIKNCGQVTINEIMDWANTGRDNQERSKK